MQNCGNVFYINMAYFKKNKLYLPRKFSIVFVNSMIVNLKIK